MTPLHGKRRAEAARRLIAVAEGQLGLTPLADGTTPYGQRAGYPTAAWSGAFVDWCFAEARTEEDGGGLPADALRLPASCVRPESGLAGFARQRRLRRRPAVGDVVFLAVPASDGGLQVGIVADCSRWDADGSVTTVEGSVRSGLPRGGDGLGVYPRTRYAADVTAFGRPALAARKNSRSRPPSAEEIAGLPLVTVAHLTTGRRSRSVELLQLALADCTENRGYDRGLYCPRTRSAVADFQRSHGRLGDHASGSPDVGTLRQLAAQTGRFRAE